MKETKYSYLSDEELARMRVEQFVAKWGEGEHAASDQKS